MPNLEKHWSFYKDNSHRWQWRKFQGDKVVAVSADGFSDRDACVRNAMERGYDGSSSETISTKQISAAKM